MIRAQTELSRKTSPVLKRYIHSTHQNYSPKTSPGTNNFNKRNIAPKSFGLGMLGGTLGSFVGIGGGVFTIPIMTSSLMGLTQRQAMATNLVAVMCTGMAGASAYAIATNQEAAENNDAIYTGHEQKFDETKSLNNSTNNVQLDMALTAAIAGMIAARLGASISHKLTEKALKRFLAGVMYMAAPAVHLPEFIEEPKNIEDKSQLRETSEEQHSIIAVSAEGDEHQQLLSEEYIITRIIPAAAIGSGAGIFSGLTGLGGGIITVSAFTLLTPLSYKQALGTSLCAMAFPATSAAIAHHFAGNIVWRVAPFLAAGAGTGAFAGGQIGANLPERELKCCFSVAMLALGTRVLFRA